MSGNVDDSVTVDGLMREAWPIILLACDRQAVLACAEDLAARYDVHDRDLSRAGQHPFIVRDSVAGTPFQCGDVPLSTAAVTLITAGGQAVAGASMIARHDAALARAIAVIDAALAGNVDTEAARALLTDGEQKIRHQQLQEQRLLAATTVDFALLGSAREETA